VEDSTPPEAVTNGAGEEDRPGDADCIGALERRHDGGVGIDNGGDRPPRFS
jgi:hypothetical protein